MQPVLTQNPALKHERFEWCIAWKRFNAAFVSEAEQ